jgi:hypothetical protein
MQTYISRKTSDPLIPYSQSHHKEGFHRLTQPAQHQRWRMLSDAGMFARGQSEITRMLIDFVTQK